MATKTSIPVRALISLWFAFCLSSFAQDSAKTNAAFDTSRSNQVSILKSLPLTFTTKAYRAQVSKMMLLEANTVAYELALDERLPIVSSNVLEEHITPPRMAKIGVGSITTSNYVYYFSVGDKFSSIVRTRSERRSSDTQSTYNWTVDLMDTNAAYRLAVKWLEAVSIDVKALNRDCQAVVRAWTPEGINGKHFIPQYRVYWVAKGVNNGGSVAGVELLLPTKSLQQLYVKKSQYILRAPLKPSLDTLTQTNDVNN